MGKLTKIIEAASWSSEVTTKKHPPEGLFSKGSAEEIAKWAEDSHDKNLSSAMASLNFYLNRAGDNLDTERKDTIEKAKKILHDKLS